MIHLNDTPGYQRAYLKDVTFAKASVQGECFWIRDVQPADEEGVFVGSIDNDLLFTGTHGLVLGDRVTFTPEP